MVDVKMIVGKDSVEEITNGCVGRNPERYHAFVETFGEGNFGLVASPGLEREILTGNPCDVAVLDRDLNVEHRENTGVACKLLLTSTFSNKYGRCVNREGLENFTGYLEKQKLEGNINNIVNSGRAVLNEDKLSCLEVKRERKVDIPPTYHFTEFDSFRQFVSKEKGSYVLKHRFDGGGSGVFKVVESNIDSFQNYNVDDYILQQELDIDSETRLIFFDGEFLGARIIQDRTKPWEDRETSGRKHLVENYTPSKEEIEETRKCLETLDSTLGCIDWVFTKDGKRYFLEFNGVGTGLGYTGGQYNLNLIVAEKLKAKYL